jgi:tetratricopeptide (TPR) repeat protein
MSHISTEELLHASDAGQPEVARIAAHLFACSACRSRAAALLRDRIDDATRELPFRALLEFATFEKGAAVERLLARAELADLRRLKRSAQKDRVIRSRSCHSPAFVEAIVAALGSAQAREESEDLASLAVLAAQGMDSRGGGAFKSDLLATIWTTTANTRRIKGEWRLAQAALVRAGEHVGAGTGKPRIRARWLSISASLRTDEGARVEAMACLAECKAIFEQEGDWPQVARTLVQMAHCLSFHAPDRSLAFLDQASPLISSDEVTLQWLVASIRTECLITLRRVEEALRAFNEAEVLRSFQSREGASLRSAFTGGKILEVLGRPREAEALFMDAVMGEIELGRYRDALLDLVYVFGFHVRQGTPERGAELSLRALAEIESQDAVVHEQLRAVWAGLIEAARAKALDEGMLASARDYVQAHWKYPAPSGPVLAREGPSTGSQGRLAFEGNAALIEPLSARAEWSLLRRAPRREQLRRISGSAACHSKAFVDVLFARVRDAGSREESEFTASLALAAIEAMDERTEVKHDLQAQLWTEIANISRLDAEWKRALAALDRAQRHLAAGTGNPLALAKTQSVAASLHADQGQRSVAVTLLEECVRLYEREGAWPLVARTLVQMAHSLATTEPARGLALIERALPLIPASDSVLRWLAASNRTECLIEMKETDQALQGFQVAEAMRAGQPRADAERRSTFTAAQLLEGLGHLREAERLFEAAIADAFSHEAYREALLDLLYLFELHVRAGATEKAAALCGTAVAQLDRFDIGHEQLRAVWLELMDAARRQAVRFESVAKVRTFLEVHWKRPSAAVPRRLR